jgi:hypothetical protein
VGSREKSLVGSQKDSGEQNSPENNRKDKLDLPQVDQCQQEGGAELLSSRSLNVLEVELSLSQGDHGFKGELGSLRAENKKMKILLPPQKP